MQSVNMVKIPMGKGDACTLNVDTIFISYWMRLSKIS